MILKPTRNRVSTTFKSLARGGVLGFMGSGAVRWFALLALLATLLPQLLAGLLVLGNIQGDHELRCKVGVRSIEITMHHRDTASRAGASAVFHRHTWLETVVIGRCRSQGEPDHHLVFGRQSELASQEDWRAGQEAGSDDLEPVFCDVLVPEPELLESSDPDLSLKGYDALSPPQLMRRGVMMRI